MPMALPGGSWALILGGSSGFGLATAHELSRHGVNLCIVHRDRRGAMGRIQPEWDAIQERGVTLLTFNEDVFNVIGNLTWTPVTGSGTMGTVTQLTTNSFAVPFSGVANGDEYTLSVPVTVTDFCGNAIAAQVDITITIPAADPTWTSCTDVGLLTPGVALGQG